MSTLTANMTKENITLDFRLKQINDTRNDILE